MLDKTSGRPFTCQAGGLCCDGRPLAGLARRFGTPLYVYSWPSLADRFRAMRQAAEQQLRGATFSLCFAVKANSNLEILRRLAALGAGFDIVSGGELERVRLAAPEALGRVVFSGVGKTAAEIDAALRADILLFNVESEAELELLASRAKALRQTARFALRVNPNVSARTHPYIATGLSRHKFGIPISQARSIYAHARKLPGLRAVGVSVHIGSQIRENAPFAGAVAQAAKLARQLVRDGEDIRYFDVGGGLAVDYDPARPFDADRVAARYMRTVATAALNRTGNGPPVHWLFEPGRFLAAHSGCLLCRVLLTKKNGRRNFAVVDAGMNDLLRPALYGAKHAIVAVNPRNGRQRYDVVGPVCETADVFASGVELGTLETGDLLAILDTGAYGMTLASNYNARPRAAEVLVQGKHAKLVRRRESREDMVLQESDFVGAPACRPVRSRQKKGGL